MSRRLKNVVSVSTVVLAMIGAGAGFNAVNANNNAVHTDAFTQEDEQSEAKNEAYGTKVGIHVYRNYPDQREAIEQEGDPQEVDSLLQEAPKIFAHGYNKGSKVDQESDWIIIAEHFGTSRANHIFHKHITNKSVIKRAHNDPKLRVLLEGTRLYKHNIYKIFAKGYHIGNTKSKMSDWGNVANILGSKRANQLLHENYNRNKENPYKYFGSLKIKNRKAKRIKSHTRKHHYKKSTSHKTSKYYYNLGRKLSNKYYGKLAKTDFSGNFSNSFYSNIAKNTNNKAFNRAFIKSEAHHLAGGNLWGRAILQSFHSYNRNHNRKFKQGFHDAIAQYSMSKNHEYGLGWKAGNIADMPQGHTMPQIYHNAQLNWNKQVR